MNDIGGISDAGSVVAAEESGAAVPPGPAPSGPAPGLLATADRLGRALAGGTGLKEPMPEETLTPADSRRKLLHLAVGIALIVGVAEMLHGTRTLFVIVALFACIMLHELGHLVMAKRAGMKVTEYFVGFGPRLWSVRKGETEYGVKPIVLGGYVRIIGMNNLDPVAPEDEARSYRSKTFPRRLSVAVAGSTVHFIIALILLFVLNSVVGITQENKALMRINGIEALTTGESPAQRAGFQPGDTILTADGRAYTNFDDLKNYIESVPGVLVVFEVERHGQRLTLAAVPADLESVTPKASDGTVDPGPAPTTAVGFLGIEPALAKQRTSNPLVAAGRSVVQFGSTLKLTFRGFAAIFSPHGINSYGHLLFGGPGAVKPADAQTRPVSVVGIVRVTSRAAKEGVEPLLTFLMAINVFVGVFNLIPLLPFDGGLVAIAIYERVRSRRGRPAYRADVARMLPVAYGVFLLLVFLSFSALYLDIAHPL
jgi:membrane-associated protease RseP (regulator of RpoE activity)